MKDTSWKQIKEKIESSGVNDDTIINNIYINIRNDDDLIKTECEFDRSDNSIFIE